MPSRSLGLPRALADYVVTSHPILIMVLTQSSGRYDIHSRILRSERAPSLPLEEALSLDSVELASPEAGPAPRTMHAPSAAATSGPGLLSVMNRLLLV